MTTWRHFHPKLVKAWNVEALAQGTEHNAVSILRTQIARWKRRADCLPSEAHVGDFALLDGRACEITALLPPGRSAARFELQDCRYPDMPRHRVAWSEIKAVAKATRDPGAHEAPVPPKS